jgi:chaperonin GroEL
MEQENLSIETLKKIASVFSLVEDHVGSTLGPDGKNVLIKLSGDRSFVTKDGVTVIKSLTFPPDMAEENAIVNIIADMSRRTDAVVGDGTTSTVVYANSLFQILLKHKKLGLRTAGLLSGAKRATQDAIRILARYAHTINSIKEIERIAYISSNGDKQISGILAQAFEEIGKEGSIILNESNAPKPFKIKVKNGFSMNSGLLTRYFINNEKKTCEVSNPYVLVTDYGITNIEPLLSIMGKVAEEGRPLVIVCDYVDGSALQAIVENSTKKNMIRVYVMTTTEYFGPNKKAVLEDVALFTGAKFVTKALGHDVQDLLIGDLGTAEKVEISMKSSIIVGGKGDQDEITKHVEFLKEQLDLIEEPSEVAEMNKRVLRFGSGVAEIFIGGSTEAEVKEKRYRIDDALMAINSALVQGFVAGGGTTFISLSCELEKLVKSEKKKMSDEEYFGYKSVIISLHSILNRLLKNSEMDSSDAGIGEKFSSLSEISGERIREKIIKSGKSGIGFNFRTRKFAKFVDKENPANSVIEPAMIVENVLSNSLSIVTLLLNTERLVCRI